MALGDYNFTGNMPNIWEYQPRYGGFAGKFVLYIYEDLPIYNDSGTIYDRYAVSIYFLKTDTFLGFVTLEVSDSMKNAMCMFDENGKHHNFGDLSWEAGDDADHEEFTRAFFSGVGF